jgi:hypothetical protein
MPYNGPEANGRGATMAFRITITDEAEEQLNAMSARE